jgi:hypothetical protein
MTDGQEIALGIVANVIAWGFYVTCKIIGRY